ncbi:unnamed protein product [Acanthoscelides obtectus]|uniref:TGF-beta family profile domain-containing protein n=1 Tax=Acanthoscelides obtectus TaxID=200917 RepID=A0A9P0KT87_ACAOB|nr:unnamed protein product [Acanthoscelides obtectus]CAK1638200.1 Bone morphogenetic protein 10 [Acanthoscelides obtectus]
MDLKWLNVLATTHFFSITHSSAMYISLIFSSLLVCLWIYILINLKNRAFSNISTSIEFNIVGSDRISVKLNNKSGGSEARKKKLVHVPKFMLELYEKNKIGNATRNAPDIVKSLIPTHAGPFLQNEIVENPSDNHLLIFDLPTSNRDEKFISAELKILTLIDPSTYLENNLKRIIKLSVYDEAVKQVLTYQETQFEHINNTWLSFDVTGPVRDTLETKSVKKCLKIIITVYVSSSQIGHTVKLSLLPERENENMEHDYPILILSYSSAEGKVETSRSNIQGNGFVRKKRNVEDDEEEVTNRFWDDDMPGVRTPIRRAKKLRNTCKRKPLYINFAEISYDMWIVQPSGYDAYQCQGRCFYPVAEHLNPTKHAIVQALLHSMSPAKATRSCCVPTTLDSISILYVDANGVLTYRYAYKDMVVVQCGCR